MLPVLWKISFWRVTSISKIPVSFHFLIHFHNDLAKQEGPSCFLLLCDHRQETGRGGSGNRAWSWLQLVLAAVTCYSTYTHSVIPAKQTGRSFHTEVPKTDIPVSCHWVVFSKTTQDTIILLCGKFEIAFTFWDLCKQSSQQLTKLTKK